MRIILSYQASGVPISLAEFSAGQIGTRRTQEGSDSHERHPTGVAPTQHQLNSGVFLVFFRPFMFSKQVTKYLQVLLSNEIVSNVLGLPRCTLITDSAYLIEHKFYHLLKWSIRLIVRYFSRSKLLALIV